MHNNVLIHQELFFNTYFNKNTKLDFLEIGSLNVNGSLKEKSLPFAKSYTGIDFTPGKDVDVILNDPYNYPFDDETFDIVLTSSCFEHSEFFWLAFLEALRLLKPSGLLWYTVPGAWMGYHQFPVDCWRFYPDSSIALEKWAKRNNINTKLLESYMTIPTHANECSDAIGIFIKDENNINLYRNRVILSTDNKCINGHLGSNNTYPINAFPLAVEHVYVN